MNQIEHRPFSCCCNVTSRDMNPASLTRVSHSLFPAVKIEPMEVVKTEDQKPAAITASEGGVAATSDAAGSAENDAIHATEILRTPSAPPPPSRGPGTRSTRLRLKIQQAATPVKGYAMRPRNPPRKDTKLPLAPASKRNVHAFLCKTCGDQFTTLGALQRHLAVHDDAADDCRGQHRPCSVAVCERAYVQVGGAAGGSPAVLHSPASAPPPTPFTLSPQPRLSLSGTHNWDKWRVPYN